jgi:hypothetical protein
MKLAASRADWSALIVSISVVITSLTFMAALHSWFTRKTNR